MLDLGWKPIPGELFVADIVAPTIEHPQNTENKVIPDAEEFDDDASAFTIQTVDSSLGRDIFNNPTGRPGDEMAVEVENVVAMDRRCARDYMKKSRDHGGGFIFHNWVAASNVSFNPVFWHHTL